MGSVIELYTEANRKSREAMQARRDGRTLAARLAQNHAKQLRGSANILLKCEPEHYSLTVAKYRLAYPAFVSHAELALS